MEFLNLPTYLKEINSQEAKSPNFSDFEIKITIFGRFQNQKS